MSSAPGDNREIQHGSPGGNTAQNDNNIAPLEGAWPAAEMPLPGPSGILVMSDGHLDDYNEEARQARIMGSQGTGTSKPESCYLRSPSPGGVGSSTPKKRVGGLQMTKKRQSPCDGSTRRKSTLYKFWDGVRRHTMMGITTDSHEEDEWDSNLWFTSLDDFNAPSCALSKSAKHDKYFVRTPAHKRHFLMHVWHKDQLSSTEVKRVRNAQSFARKLRHPNIIKFYGEWETDGALYIVEEYCFRGDMAYQLVANKRNLTENYVANNVVRPVLCALSQLHHMGIVHRAVWPENIFLSRDGDTRLSCFLYAIDLHQRRPASREGYVDYMAPEVLRMEDIEQPWDSPRTDGREDRDEPIDDEHEERGPDFGCGSETFSNPGYDEKVDIWQLGTLVFELLTGRCPFEVDDPELTATLILWANIQKYPVEFSPGAINFLERALAKDPAQRPSADELIEHPWIKAQQILDVPESADGESSMSRCTTPGFVSQACSRISSFFARLPSPLAFKLRAKSTASEPVPADSGRTSVAGNQSQVAAGMKAEDEEVKRILMPSSGAIEFTPVETTVKVNQEEALEDGEKSTHSRMAWTSPSPAGGSHQADFSIENIGDWDPGRGSPAPIPV